MAYRWLLQNLGLVAEIEPQVVGEHPTYVPGLLTEILQEGDRVEKEDCFVNGAYLIEMQTQLVISRSANVIRSCHCKENDIPVNTCDPIRNITNEA